MASDAKYVVDFDDLCDKHDPFNKIMELKGRFPGLKVTLFAIPGMCSDELLEKHGRFDWIELAVHGYYHSTRECAIWTYEDTLEKMREVEEWWPGVKVFKAPGWVASTPSVEALEDDGWMLAVHADHEETWRTSGAKMYIYNTPRPDVIPIHGHTLDVCDNGPSDWDALFKDVPREAEFAFVSEVCRSRSYLEQNDLGLKPGDLFVDIGAFIGEEIQSCVARGVRIESYEPHPDWFKKLQSKWGGHPLVTLREMAVWENGETRPFWQPAPGRFKSGSSLVESKGGLDLTNAMEVQCIDAKDVVEGKDITILKIDAEGAEWNILERIMDTCGLDRVGRLFVEDHKAKMGYDDEWLERRARVLERIAAAGKIVEEWP